VGALGNALWEFLFKPFVVWMTNFLLGIATLGINSLRDDLYMEMAKGIFDRSGVAGYTILTGFAFSICIILASIGWSSRKELPRLLARRVNLFEAGKAPDFPPGWILRRLSRAVIALAALAMLLGSLLLFMFTREVYVLRGAIYLSQSERIVAPYLTPQDRVLLASRISMMRSKADFDAVNDQLKAVSQANKLRLPDFSAF
jgi:hypothetical protein